MLGLVVPSLKRTSLVPTSHWLSLKPRPEVPPISVAQSVLKKETEVTARQSLQDEHQEAARLRLRATRGSHGPAVATAVAAAVRRRR